MNCEPENIYSPGRSLREAISRRFVQLVPARPIKRLPSHPIVSFTFDDFPKSAAEYGADILSLIGAQGTYYACTGVVDQTSIMGKMYSEEDLRRLSEGGHEIGAHTHSHLDCAKATVESVRHEISNNVSLIEQLAGIEGVASFAWPFGETKLLVKSSIQDLVKTSRGIRPGINGRGSDLYQLKSYELTPEQWTTQRAAIAIEKVARVGGWLTIFTHDVRPNPSPFGTTPQALKQLVRLARDSGCGVLTISKALDEIRKMK